MPNPSSASASVLIVEDELEFRREFERMVRSAPDLRLIGSADGVASALAFFDGEPVDILLVDLGLPDGDGVSLIREASRRWPGRCEIMVVSVFADQRNIIAAIEAGANGYLLKDSSPTSFIEQIRALRAGGSPVSPLIARQLIMRFAPSRVKSFSAEGEEVSLSPSETEVLRYAARGFSYDEVAGLMGISRHTVMSYVKRIYAKLQVHSKTEALYEARRMGLVRD